MKLFLIIYMCAVYICFEAEAQNYCTWKYTFECRMYADELTLCGAKKGKFGASCPQNTTIVNISEKEFLDFVNNNRKLLAKEAPASRMNQVNWCKKLALIAEHSVRQCNGKKTFCPKTSRFADARLITKEFKYAAENSTTNSIWLHLWNNLKTAYLQKPQKIKDFEEAAGYAHFVHDQTTHIGCAIASYTKANDVPKYLLGCVFSHSPHHLEPYKLGKPASDCESDKASQQYNGLCEVAEEDLKKVSDICGL